MAHRGKRAFEITDEAVHLLRLSPFSLLSVYYIGTLPFILGLLYFWGDMSRNAFAREYCAVSSFGIAILFVWMKCWQAAFLVHVRSQISRKPMPHWSFRRMMSLAVTQTIIQPTGFIVLPVALMLTIPFGWCYAFYQNVSAEDDGEFQDTKQICKKAWEQARRWPRQNHILLFVFFLFGSFIFLNLAVTVFLLPRMLKTLLGIETLFTMSGLSVLNTTFLAAIFSITYLCMDPLVKTVYALRCFYGSSLKSGEDLKVELKNFSLYGKKLVMILLFFSWMPNAALGGMENGEWRMENGNLNSQFSILHSQFSKTISSKELDQSINKIMSQRKFTWRMPREEIREAYEPPGPFESLMNWIIKKIKSFGKTVKRLINSVLKRLDQLLPDNHRIRELRAASDWMPSVRNIFLTLLVLLTCILAIFFWLTRRKRKKTEVKTVSKAIPSAPDLTDDEIRADDLPADRWLLMAKELLEKGELRMAVRAFYLATLAHLAEHEMITIAKYKSNRDYQQELYRRAHEKQALLSLFLTCVQVFDKVWYGMYEVNQKDVSLFAENYEKLKLEI
ncbi:hypothetical protein [Desulfonema magnum]|uniref:DUF4129 domain-containing protein n=1 Tax=Desulfonema magnum TaxID=45655 RepID=A0A975BMY1_9BACT|nr:hypothetical protein [Desulfonema magnum]QTA88669.1 Uncharacterized protein dnm_047160 [Desulfonema magnum]